MGERKRKVKRCLCGWPRRDERHGHAARMAWLAMGVQVKGKTG